MKKQVLQQQLVQYERGENSALSNTTSISAIRNSGASKSALSNSATSHSAILK